MKKIIAYSMILGVYLLSVSEAGMGGAAGAPPNLIAHYKMNENTAGDNAELVTNGDFAAWTADNPDSWTVVGEVGADPEISEAATGEAHADTPTPGGGMCNIYTSDGTVAYAKQTISLVVGRRYRGSVTIDTVTAGGFRIADLAHAQFDDQLHTTTGTKTWTFVATATSFELYITRKSTELSDVTIDDVSLKLCAIEDSSGNDHDGVAQQDTSAIAVAGKINGAFSFNGLSDSILIPDHDDFSPVGTPFSISAWVKMVDATYFTIAKKGLVTVDGEWRFRVSNVDMLDFILWDESKNQYIGRRYGSALTAYENQWLHVVATSDGGILSSGIGLYLSGTRVDDENYEGTGFESVENLGGSVSIGKDDTYYSEGIIDNIMFFAAELTQDEVNILYNNGAGTEIPAELDQMIRPRRANLSPLPQRRRYEY